PHPRRRWARPRVRRRGRRDRQGGRGAARGRRYCHGTHRVGTAHSGGHMCRPHAVCAVALGGRRRRARSQVVSVVAVSSALRVEGASGTGLATIAADGTVLDTWYPSPALGPDAPDVPVDLESLVSSDDARGVRTVVVRTAI